MASANTDWMHVGKKGAAIVGGGLTTAVIDAAVDEMPMSNKAVKGAIGLVLTVGGGIGLTMLGAHNFGPGMIATAMGIKGVQLLEWAYDKVKPAPVAGSYQAERPQTTVGGFKRSARAASYAAEAAKPAMGAPATRMQRVTLSDNTVVEVPVRGNN